MMKWKLKQDSSDLQNAIKLLKEDYKADVAILQDDDGNFKALYFSTETMKSSVSAFPEIIFLDGTYKLLNNGLTLMLFVVEDSNGLTEVGGVVLIVHEDYETFKWFLTKFRENNELASSKIKCFMTDKDLLERNVIKEIFVGIPVYTCLFHTLKIFRRTVTTDKYDISKKERETCLELLTKLAYSSSEEAYEQAYTVFVDTCPPTIVDYFNKNWHLRFVLKPLETQKLQVLREMVLNEDAIQQCIEGEYKIKITDMKNPNCLSHCLFDPQIDLSIIQDLLDSTAFQHILEYIDIAKSNYEWCCTICSSPLGEFKSICCDSCMKWYHFKFVGLVRVPVRRTWFCRKCF